jgi:hypothetical protein
VPRKGGGFQQKAGGQKREVSALRVTGSGLAALSGATEPSVSPCVADLQFQKMSTKGPTAAFRQLYRGNGWF